MGQNQGRERRAGGVTGAVKNVLRNGPLPLSDALVGRRQEGAPPQQHDQPVQYGHPEGQAPDSQQFHHQQPAAHEQHQQPPAQYTAETYPGGAQQHLPPPQQEVAQEPEQPLTLPVIIRYKFPHPIGKGEKMPKKDIKLLLDSNQWKPIPMSPSDDNYYAVCYLQPGQHNFKFDVEGEVVLDTTQPVASQGEPANTLQVTEAQLFSKQEEADLINNEDGWGQIPTEFDETRKHPPIMPPHLRYTPLNSPPTQIRCDVDGNMTMAPTGAVPLDPEHMPLPLSVTINHAYFQRRDDHTVLGITTRYKNKFTTVAYYKKE